MNRREFNWGLLSVGAITALPDRQSKASPRINAERVMSHLTALSEFGKNPQGGVSRIAYSEADLMGRQYTMKLMREAKLDVGIDTAGNIIGRRAGSEAGLPPLVIGSHIDSVPEGGNYDGDVGSMGAIEVAQTLAENDIALRHPLAVIIFQNEEGGTFGSHAIAQGLTEKELDRVSNSGKTIRDGIKYLGGDPGRLEAARWKRGELAAYLELHIEQGGVLHSEKLNIGVVQGIVGISQWEVTIEGFANHAGTTPMDKRRDALLAAAGFISAVNRIVKNKPGRQVGTIGKIQAQPGAYNVIPGKVILGLELRDLDAAKIQTLFQEIHTESRQIAKTTGTEFSFKEVNSIVPALCDNRIQKVIDETAKQLGFTTKSMPSGAGHDAQEMAGLGPAGMIFIPSVDGISHSPQEFSEPGDIANGANVLLQVLLKLDSMKLV